jgi:type I restriction enzyme R subunit
VLNEALEALRYHCEPVAPPREVEQYLHYFCGDAANPDALRETEQLRISFYKAVATLVRAFADIAQHLDEAGYSDADAAKLQKEVEFYSEIRSAIKKHSSEEFDIKPYEADMRHLLNTYVQADPAADLGNLDSLPLTEMIVETRIRDAIARKLNEKGRLSRNAIAEAIRRSTCTSHSATQFSGRSSCRIRKNLAQCIAGGRNICDPHFHVLAR